MIRRFIAIFALALALPAGLDAQAAEPELVDRVVAVVGDSVILASDLTEQIERRRAFGEPVPTDPEALDLLRRQELETLINELVMIQAAQRDSIAVPETDVRAQVEATVAEQERRFGGRAAFEAALRNEGMTLEQYRELVAEGVRRSALQQRFQASLQQERRPPPVTDAEVREFFEARRAELGQRPATIEFDQILVTPRAAEEAREEALSEARDILRQLQEGADFEELARRYTDDASTRQQGGELGWFRRGRMVPEFERAAFGLRPGQTSGIIETTFGFHIIKVERVRGPERFARHILIRPEISEAAQAMTVERAEEVAEELRAGAPLDSLVEAVHDPREESRVGPVLQDSLPEPYRTRLRAASPGQVVGPFEVPAAGEAFAVVRVRDVKEAGEYTLEDEELAGQIRQFLQREKLMQEALDELRRGMYIDIRY